MRADTIAETTYRYVIVTDRTMALLGRGERSATYPDAKRAHHACLHDWAMRRQHGEQCIAWHIEVREAGRQRYRLHTLGEYQETTR